MPFKKKKVARDWRREYYRANKTRMKAAMAAYAKRRRKFIADFKNKPCMDCGGWFHPVQMDFDHRPGEHKSFGLSQPLVKKLVDLYKEMKKCDVVCANCHRLRTYRRNEHGASLSVCISRELDRNQL